MDTAYNRHIASEYDALNSRWVEHNRRMWDGSLYGGINTRYGSAMEAVGNHPRMSLYEKGLREEFSGMGGARNAIADVGIYHPYRNLGINTASYDVGACYGEGSRGFSGGMRGLSGGMSGSAWWNNWDDFVGAVEGVVEGAKGIYNDYIKPALDVVGTPVKEFLKGKDNPYAQAGADVLEYLGYGMYGRRCGKGGVRLRGRGGKMFEIHPCEIMEAGKRQGIHKPHAKYNKVIIGMGDRHGVDIYHIDPKAIHRHLRKMKGGSHTLVGEAWWNDWDDFCGAVSDVVEGVKGVYNDYIKPALDVVGTPLKEFLQSTPNPYAQAGGEVLDLLGYGDLQELSGDIDHNDYDFDEELVEKSSDEGESSSDEEKEVGAGMSSCGGSKHDLGYSPHLNLVQMEEARGSTSYKGMPNSVLGGNAMGREKAKSGWHKKGIEDVVPAGRENIWHGNEDENRKMRSGYANPSLVLKGKGDSKEQKKEVEKEMEKLEEFEGKPHISVKPINASHWSDEWLKPDGSKLVIHRPVAVKDPVHPLTTKNDMQGQWSAGAKPDKRKARAEIVKKVMKEKGLKMVDASRYVKEHGLYKP